MTIPVIIVQLKVGTNRYIHIIINLELLFGLSFEKRKDLTWWKAKSSNQDDADYADYAAADYVDYMYNPWIMQIMWIIRP